MKPGDPTREELIRFLETAYREASGEEPCASLEVCPDGCPCRLEIESCAYWIAEAWHGGQWSNLYSVLSTSEYRPGLEGPPTEDDRPTEFAMLEMAEQWIRGGCQDAS